VHGKEKINMVLIKKDKSEKSSKGYRLKISTHKLIDEMQIILNADQDEVITKACELLYKELSLKNNKTINPEINN
jgi:hypothetical protein